MQEEQLVWIAQEGLLDAYLDLESGREVWYVLGAGIPTHMPGLAFLSLLAQDLTMVGVGSLS